jgi:hypothetical protein
MTDTERITNEVYDRFMEKHENPMNAAIGARNGLILAVILWGLVLVAVLLIRGCK